MNTEKIEKLKKSLSNPKIPADLKPKIEAEIKRLEDLDAKSSQPKEEAKEEEKPVAKKTSTRKPRATKTVAKKTSTRKPSETSNPKRTIMSVAKEIRKEGESWKDAQERDKKVMKKDSQEVTKTIETELQKLNKLVKSRKELRSQVGKTDLLRDAKRKAKPMGRRISKEGNVYYENRANRTDRGSFGKYHLAEGGYLTDPNFGNFQNTMFADGGGIPNNYAGKTPEDVWNNWTLKQRQHFLKDHLVLQGKVEDYRASLYRYDELPKDLLSKIETKLTTHLKEGQYAKGGGVRKVGKREYSFGRNWTNDHNHVNKGEDHEVKYTRKKRFELGGVMATDLAGHTGGSLGGDPTMLDGMSGTHYTGLVGETGAISSGEMFMNGGTLPEGVSQPYMITESLGNPAQHFAKGGGVRKVGNREYSYGRNWTNDHNHVNKGEDHEVTYNRKGKFLGIFKEGGAIKNQYAGRTPEDIWDSLSVEQRKHFLIDHLWGNEEQIEQLRYKRLEEDDKEFVDYYAVRTWKKLSGDVRKAFTSHVKEGEYNKGGALTNERLHVNHDEDYEVRYAKPRPSRKGYKGARKFMSGGSMETPKIYVANLEAYNNGQLIGEWLDLSDYNDADELMDAIQDLLDQWGVEEYAIHDVEYVPSSMYSEYMGKRDFEELYEMIDLAKDNNLPLEVVQEIVSQYSESAVEDFYGKYDSAVDFAEQLVDDLGIQSFNDFEYYLDVSETDRRLLSQEMADSYVDDIRNEDGGNRLIEEAGLDVEEYEEADSDRQEEMLDEAREIVYDEYYDTWYEGLSDPYYFLVEEQGLYSAEDFANASFVLIDYDKLADALEQDYTFIEHDGEVYVFNIR